ncbi:uncharacterized protein B0J16DRAFT_331395 [Fusarium flagelliforme]|uniref:uncharacterized protein n=1 Tax=Fusarium flagelliforme TaxID=2675880 RepID=UPI001E8E966F|nr:uncharacterized protein B0J16DRAFT_331395 [Fusarium flagelliforme]KAH7198949.1 hypothetical protein B0J16DRAFT_331395 [Fusarium flagelliforme]
MNLASIVFLIGLAFQCSARPFIIYRNKLNAHLPWPEDKTHHNTVDPDEAMRSTILHLPSYSNKGPSMGHATNKMTPATRGRMAGPNTQITVIRYEETINTVAIYSQQEAKPTCAIVFNKPHSSSILERLVQVAVDPIFLVLISISITLFVVANVISERGRDGMEFQVGAIDFDVKGGASY